MAYNSGRTGDATKTLLNQVDANALKLGPLADTNIPSPLPYIGEDVIVLGANNSNCLVKTTMNGMANKYGIIHFDNSGHAKIEEATNILNAVQYTAQSLTTSQQEQARNNIGAGIVDANPVNYFAQGYFIVGDNQGSWTVASSTMKPTDSSTSWSTSSDINVPTMKAISDYISSLNYSTTTGTVTSVRVQAGTGLSSSQSTAQSTTLNTTISVAPGYQLVDENDQEFSGTKTFVGSNADRTAHIDNTELVVEERIYTDPEDPTALMTVQSGSVIKGSIGASYSSQTGSGMMVISQHRIARIYADEDDMGLAVISSNRTGSSLSNTTTTYGLSGVNVTSRHGASMFWNSTYEWPHKPTGYTGTIAMMDDIGAAINLERGSANFSIQQLANDADDDGHRRKGSALEISSIALGYGDEYSFEWNVSGTSLVLTSGTANPNWQNMVLKYIYSSGSDTWNEYRRITGVVNNAIAIDSALSVTSGVITASVITGVALGEASFTSGAYNRAFGESSYAGGKGTAAVGDYSSTDGWMTLANQTGSHASGRGTIAAAPGQTAVGNYNAIDFNAPFVVGNGSDGSHRSTAFKVNANGTATIGAAPVNNMDVVTKQYADSLMTPGLIGTSTITAKTIPQMRIGHPTQGFNGPSGSFKCATFNVGTVGANSNGVYVFTYAGIMLMFVCYGMTANTLYYTYGPSMISSYGGVYSSNGYYYYVDDSGILTIFTSGDTLPDGYVTYLHKLKMY